MTAHELARLLLARRDNDVMVCVEVNNDPAESGNPELYDTHWVHVEEVRYDSDLDRLIIVTEEASGPAWGEE